MPGRAHPLKIEADEPGVYRGQCTEFCGLSHANMRMRVVALSPEDYADWEASQQEPAKVPTERARQGRSRCLPHHLHQLPPGQRRRWQRGPVLRRPAQVSGAAPNLTHFVSRGTFAGGIFDLWVDQDGNGEIAIDERGTRLNIPDLEAWLRDPPAGSRWYPQGGRGMPNLHLTEEQIDQLVAYLETLK